MIHQTQPNHWTCLPTSFAIVLGCEVSEIFDYLKHDGSDVLWPDLPEPMCRRSFHIQEMYDFCLDRNYAVTPFVPVMGIAPIGGLVMTVKDERIVERMSHYQGVLTGHTHAVAWSGDQVFDPSNVFTEGIEFEVLFFHIVTRVSNK